MGVGQSAVDRCDGAIEIPQAGTKIGQRLGVGRRRFMEFLLPNPSEALTLPRCKT